MKKIKVVIGILIMLFAVLAVLAYFYPQFFEKLPSLWGKAIPEGSLPESLGVVTQAEKERVWEKTYEEVVAEFNQERQNCLDRFRNVTDLKNVLEADANQALSSAVCQALRAGDKDICGELSGNESVFRQCREITRTYLDLVFPSFQNKNCAATALSAEEKNICGGMVFDKPENCARVANALQKAICLAVAENKISDCDALAGGDKDNCQDFYYFARAVKENNQSYLDKVKSSVGSAVYKLYFNRDLACVDLFASSNEKYCQETFSADLLKRRLSIWSELINLSPKD